MYSYSTEGAVHLRWNAPLGQNSRGIYVERQPIGGGWQRLNEQAIKQISDVAEIRRLLGYNAAAYLTFFDSGAKTIDDAKFQEVMGDEIARGMIQLFSVKFPQFGKVLGEVYSDRELQPGTEFTYRIIAEIDGQNVTWAQTLTPVSHGVPDRIPVPLGLLGKGGDSTAMLSWQHDPELSRSGQRIGYRVYRADDPSGPFELESIETVIPTRINGELPEDLYTNNYLVNGTPYWFKITGVNVLGYESAFTETIKVTPQDETPPRSPVGFKGRLQVETSLLQWEPNIENDLEGYRLYRSTEASGPYEQIWPAENELLAPMISHVDEDVPEGSMLWYQVTAVDFSANESRPSDTIQIFRKDVTPPSQVMGVKALGVGKSKDAGIHLSWDANTEADLQGYLVERTSRVEGKGEEAQVISDFYIETPQPLNETHYKDLIPENSESRYAYRIVAVDQVWNRSKPSETVIAQMPDIVPPTRPALSYVRLEKDKVHIAWSPNVEDDLAGYKLLRSKEDGEFAAINNGIIAPTVVEFFDRPTEFNQIFRYSLIALDEAGNASEPSARLSVTMVDLVGPNAPAIARIDVEEVGLHVHWELKQARDFTTLILYRVGGQEGPANILSYLEPDAEEFIDTNVVEDEPYTYFLRATDKQRNLGEPGESATQRFSPDQRNDK